MISLIVAKLETNFLQRNYLGQSLAEADTLCETGFHFQPFKKFHLIYQILLLECPGKKELDSQQFYVSLKFEYLFRQPACHTNILRIFLVFLQILGQMESQLPFLYIFEKHSVKTGNTDL